MPETRPQHAPKRYAQWLDELKKPMELRTYASVQAVAERLRKTNPLLSEQRANWLAGHWSRKRDDGHWEILGDPAHKHHRLGGGRPDGREQVVGQPVSADGF